MSERVSEKSGIVYRPSLSSSSNNYKNWGINGEGRFMVNPEPLAITGFSVVYWSHDRNLGIPVAIKLMHKNYATDSNMHGLLKREASTMANVRHPGIIEIYDYFETNQTPFGDDTLFIPQTPCLVMRYEHADTNLKNRIDKSSLPSFQDVVKITLELADTVDYMAFDQGIFHRDLKPGNIYLSPHHTKIGDFGAATTIGIQRLGSPSYLSPERIVQNEETAASEVYILASVVYEMITGKKRFNPETSLSAIAVLAKIASSEGLDTDAHETLDKALIHTDVSASKVADILSRAQRRKPSARYQTATEFAQDLANALG